jgi:hypothetical protein
LEAAKRFIKKRGRACTLDEIVSGICAGGCQDVKEEELGKSLSRSTLEVAKVGEDLYGLVEFYPEVKRERKRKPTELKTPADGNGKLDSKEMTAQTTAEDKTIEP